MDYDVERVLEYIVKTYNKSRVFYLIYDINLYNILGYKKIRKIFELYCDYL